MNIQQFILKTNQLGLDVKITTDLTAKPDYKLITHQENAKSPIKILWNGESAIIDISALDEIYNNFVELIKNNPNLRGT